MTKVKLPFKKSVEKEIKNINKMLELDGGGIKLISAKNKLVKIKFFGECVDCPSASITLKEGIEKHLRDRILDIEKVEAVTK